MNHKIKLTLKTRQQIINYIYQCELFDKKIDGDDAFSNLNFEAQSLTIIDQIGKDYDELQKTIQKYLKKTWEWSRTSPLARAILIYGAYEMQINDPPLVINEMIIISKLLIPDDSYKFINSILDKINKEYGANQKNQKST